MIIDNVKRLTLFSLLTSLLGCTSVSHTPQVFLGENLITPYTGFLAGWKVIIENQAHYHSRMWQHPTLGFKSSYVVSVTPKEKHNNKYFRNIIDKPGIESCINFSSETINSTIDTNYPKEFWQTTCLRKNGSEAKILHLLIQGNDSLYHIQKIWQDKYSLEEISLWQSRLEQSYVCDSRSLEAKCPQNND